MHEGIAKICDFKFLQLILLTKLYAIFYSWYESDLRYKVYGYKGGYVHTNLMQI